MVGIDQVNQLLSGMSGGGATETKKAHDELGQSDFLTLLIKQLENQDPLKPTDSDSFIQQVTAFNQLDQLFKLVEIGKQSLELQGGSVNTGGGNTIIDPTQPHTPPEIQLSQ
jgi:flagellar hook assembly protein FlgD